MWERGGFRSNGTAIMTSQGIPCNEVFLRHPYRTVILWLDKKAGDNRGIPRLVKPKRLTT